ncbi:MAG: H-NS histone family protein [Gammaproteobacteria bacterium]|nr:H-NS histone family protein [Gammaproteobacteria bacterium]
MSLLSDYRSKKDALRLLQDELKRMEEDGKLAKELDFEEKLRALLNEHGKSLKDVISILDPQGAAVAEAKAKRTVAGGKERAIKRYVNPHTKEVVETRGGNHKVLKAWKAQYGAVVERWLEN